MIYHQPEGSVNVTVNISLSIDNFIPENRGFCFDWIPEGYPLQKLFCHPLEKLHQ